MPTVLVTTPESLTLMLTREKAREELTGVEYVVIKNTLALRAVNESGLVGERLRGPTGLVVSAGEVSRGPGSVAYGSDAFGGVIHARPRDPLLGRPRVRRRRRAGAANGFVDEDVQRR